MTIAVPTSGGWTFDAQLVEERGVLMLYEPNRAKHRTFCALAAVLKIGWRIVGASREEWAVLEAHGFSSGRVQVRRKGQSAPGVNRLSADERTGERSACENQGGDASPERHL